MLVYYCVCLFGTYQPAIYFYFQDDESEDLQFLEGLRGIDPDKLNRLKDRLVTPYKAGGPRPEPSFPGYQEFYRDFILSTSHLSFLQHLQDSLISHLLELDQTPFLASDTEDSGTAFNTLFFCHLITSALMCVYK